MALSKLERLEVIEEDFLLCKICSYSYTDPRILPCLHSFCKECLDQWTTKNDGLFTCPTCCKMCQLEAGGTDRLPSSNLLIDSLVSVVQEIRNTTTPTGISMSCASCESMVGKRKCEECTVDLCGACISKHADKDNSKCSRSLSHELQEEQLLCASSSEYRIEASCSKHPDNNVEMYCITCDISICKECSLVEHCVPEHQHKKLGDAVAEKKHQTRVSLTALRAKTRVIDRTEKAVKSELDTLAKHKEEAEKKITQHFECVISHVTQMKDRALDSVDEISQSTADSLNSQLRKLQASNSLIKKTLDFSEKLMLYSSPSQYLMAQRTIEDRLEHLQEIEIENTPKLSGELQFQEDESMMKCGFGVIKGTTVSGSRSEVMLSPLWDTLRAGEGTMVMVVTRDKEGETVTAYGVVRAELLNPQGARENVPVTDSVGGTHSLTVRFSEEGQYNLKVFVGEEEVTGSPFSLQIHPPRGTVNIFGGEGTGAGLFHSPKGLVVDNKDRVVVVDRDNHRIQIQDWEGRHHDTIEFCEFPKQFTPTEITISPDDDYYVTDIGNRQIVGFKEDRVVVSTYGHDFITKPTGIASTNATILVTEATRKGCLKIFQTDEDDVKSIGIQNKPAFVKVVNHNKIMISDASHHRIQVLNMTGDIINLFGSRGSADDQFNNPQGLDIDREGNILICDCDNNRISLYSSEGTYLRQVVTSGTVTKPCRIAVSRCGPQRIAVTEFNKHTVKVIYI
ncbi:E3 ubiquitin-protein ligase TRIM71-like [Saccoglossus kowalevskii]|uniref:E3 ubiquitin-protein ligase TRIM71-like n=1 Tax=Saccoglossus kowalevskii TaxID=10224 RepID=A0ABM0MXJ7_SACKO|nr:PREDICTED: E3 ubiquitin-protein ligase TRIM71-like [Saccoglossus kowalevskii]